MKAAALAIVLALCVPVTSAPAIATKPRVRIVDATVTAGGILTAKGTGWPGSARVRLLIGPPASEASPVALVRTTTRGTFTERIRIARLATPGRYVLLACRRQCRTKASAKFSILPR